MIFTSKIFQLTLMLDSWYHGWKIVSFQVQVSIDDFLTSSICTERYITERLKSTGHYVEYEPLVGGHVMEPPYFPFHEGFFARFASW